MATLNGNKISKDENYIISLMKSVGIKEFEISAIDQLLEFTHRYTEEILVESKSLAEYAAHWPIQPNDIKLALQILSENKFTTPPSLPFLHDLAKGINTTKLPLISDKENLSVQLPSMDQCLMQNDFQIYDEQIQYKLQNGNKY